MAPPTIPSIDRFNEKYRVDETTGCWLWTGSIRANGYGQFRVTSGKAGKNGYAHRFAFEYYVGKIPSDVHVHHNCRDRSCVNPAHLELLSPSEHAMRDDTPARRNAAKTHCPAGHPYSGGNLRMYRGHRHCRACAKRRYDA